MLTEWLCQRPGVRWCSLFELSASVYLLNVACNSNSFEHRIHKKKYWEKHCFLRHRFLHYCGSEQDEISLHIITNWSGLAEDTQLLIPLFKLRESTSVVKGHIRISISRWGKKIPCCQAALILSDFGWDPNRPEGPTGGVAADAAKAPALQRYHTRRLEGAKSHCSATTAAFMTFMCNYSAMGLVLQTWLLKQGGASQSMMSTHSWEAYNLCRGCCSKRQASALSEHWGWLFIMERCINEPPLTRSAGPNFVSHSAFLPLQPFPPSLWEEVEAMSSWPCFKQILEWVLKAW